MTLMWTASANDCDTGISGNSADTASLEMSLAWAPANFKGNLQWTVGIGILTHSSARRPLTWVIDRARTGTRTANFDSFGSCRCWLWGRFHTRFWFPSILSGEKRVPKAPKSCPTDGSFNREQHFLIKVHSHTQLSLVTRPYWKQLLIFTSFLTATVIDIIHIFWGSFVLFRMLFHVNLSGWLLLCMLIVNQSVFLYLI